MRRIIRESATDPTVYGLARHIVSGQPEKSWSAEVNALFYFVRDNIRYTLDPYECEGLQIPTQTLKLGTGDCDDKVMLLGSLLRSIGHPVKLVAVQVDNSPHYSHVFLQTRVGAAWLGLETTEKWRPGEISPRITGKAIVVDV